MCKISVVVPIYNAEEYLDRCILSIINQTLKDIEIILVNDGSTDNSKNICKKYLEIDNRIIFVDKENEGPSKARNKGLEIAKGEYVSFIDSDDFIDEKFLINLYDEATKNNADICGCLFDEYKNGKYNNVFEESDLEICKLYSSNEFAKYFYCSSSTYQYLCSAITVNKIYRRDIVKGTYFINSKVSEDEDFSFKVLLKSSKVCIINKILYHISIENENSLTRSSFGKSFGIKNLIFLDILDNRKDILKDKKMCFLYKKNIWLICNMTIEYYYKSKKYIKNYNLNILKIHFNQNFKEALKYKDIKVKDKLRFLIFFFSPYLYSKLVLKDKNRKQFM